MAAPRHPRFQRAGQFPPMELTPRDAEVLRIIRQHRFLRSSHLAALIGGSRQQLLRRLQSLYHHGFVERPLSQLNYFQRGGSQSMVYGLGNRGAAFFAHEDGDTGRLDWNTRNRNSTRLFLDHALMISDILVAIELGCRRNQALRVSLSDARRKPEDGKWKAPIKGAAPVTVIPDALFTIHRTKANGSDETIIFCLEADRGTMPVRSSNRLRSSIARKLTAYEASWRANIFRQRFNATRVQILTVTNSPVRLSAILEHARAHVSAAGLFHFSTLAQITESPERFLESILDATSVASGQNTIEFSPLPAT